MDPFGNHFLLQHKTKQKLNVMAWYIVITRIKHIRL